MKIYIYNSYLKNKLVVFGVLFALSNLAHASDGVDREHLSKFLNIYLEAADMVGVDTYDQNAIQKAGAKLQKFFSINAKITVGNTVIIDSNTGNAPILFSQFVGRLFSHNGYYSTRYNADTGSGLVVEQLEDNTYKVISFVTADHYQDNNAMLKLAGHYEDIIIKTNRQGHPNRKGKHFRVISRSVFIDGMVSINGGFFEMPTSVIGL